MPRPRVPDGRPVSDRPAPPNAYRSGCAQEPALVACRGLLAAVSSVQVIPRINLRPPSSSHRCSYHIDGITPRQPLQTLKTKTFTHSEVRAQRASKDGQQQPSPFETPRFARLLRVTDLSCPGTTAASVTSTDASASAALSPRSAEYALSSH